MNFLGVIVDCDAFAWGAYLDEHTDKDATFKNLLSAIASFCNAHLLSSLNNELLLVAGGINGESKKLYSKDSKFSENQVGEIESKLREALIQSACQDPSAIVSRYAAAVSLTICGNFG